MIDPATDAAVALLRDVVADFLRRGRSTVAAGIKPELQRRSPVGFDETVLGFARFLDFLEFAAAQGVVHVERVGGQPLVTLPGDPAYGAETRERQGRRRPRVRADLWEAFTNWGQWQRAWDQVDEVAIRLPLNESPHEAPQVQRLRQELKSDASRFIEIAGIPQDEQTAWMHDFAAGQPGKLGLLLRFALQEEERKAQAFTQILRETPDAYARWLDLRVEKVLATIEEWRQKHSVRVQVVEREQPVSEPAAEPLNPREEPGQHQAPTNPISELELRALAHRAVDGMSYDEMLRLPIQLGNIVRRA